MEGIRGFFNSLRFGTRFLTFLMIVIYICQFAFLDSSLTSLLTFCPRLIIEHGQVWRLITASYMHGGILHLAMNMMSFTMMGITLEMTLGTLSFFYHILLLGVVTGLTHVAIAYLMSLGGEASEVGSHALGFSGILFALIVIDVQLSGGDERSVFGLFLVPAWTYPWVMLLLMSLLMPNVSFFGHLSGMVTGYLYQFHILSYLAPGPQFFGRLERKLCCCCMNRLGYLPVEGQRDANYQPFALLTRLLRRETPAGETEAVANPYQGQARTLGDIGGDGVRDAVDDLEPMTLNLSDEGPPV
jgi:membrane associated rhomboid family serine protease